MSEIKAGRTESIHEMRARHQQEIDELQASCHHEKLTGWIPYMWAPGHLGGMVQVCEFCGRIVAERG